MILEVSFFRFFHNGPDCCENIADMKQKGLFRHQHFYATPEQWEAQNRQMKAHLAELFQRRQ